MTKTLGRLKRTFLGETSELGAVSFAQPSTVETAYKVYVCPRGNLLYMWIYLITDLKLL